MKTIKYIVSLAVVCMLAMSMSAEMRHYEDGEKIYLNVNQGQMNWSNDNAHLFLYIYGNSGNNWVTLSRENGDIFVGNMPAGDWDKFIVVRKNNTTSTGGWDNNVWNRTCNLPFINNPDINCINEFWKGGETEDKKDCEGSANWATYAPSLAKIGKFAADETEENMKVCSNALGSSLSLHPKLNSDASNYDYDNVKCHGWYVSTDKSTWSSIDGYAGGTRDGEKEQDASYVLPNSLSSGAIYFYLHSSKKVGRRLIKLTLTDEGCDLDCKITFFGVACSEVNANDTTYTLDGMVAFGVPCGDLVIECDGKSKIIKADTAKSPQIFSIEGLRAATKDGTTATATAKFTGNEAGKVTATVNIPNVSQGITYKHIDVLVGETAPLEPTGANYSNKHIWYIDGEQTGKQGKQTSKASDKPNVTRYAYREFNPPSGSMVNMMSNGNYESEDASVYGGKGDKPSAISQYRFWGQYPQTDDNYIDFYMNTAADINPSGWTDDGFAVVKNANNFFKTFAKVKPQEGNYFALFDAASDGVANKKAWLATTANNENLKLQKGTTYLFSFWAANINNYGEMDNAAKLQFQIEYNGKTEKLGSVLDLDSAEFRNNRWHQCSATFTADANADNVTISVVNLNTNKLYTGNDFALDDIQFRAVSSPTRSVKMQQVFTVETHEPHIYAMAATANPMPCGEKKYDVTIKVEYDNPKGKLVVKDLTANNTVFEGAVPTDHGDWDQKKTKTITYTIDDNLTPAKHEYKAYFDEWTKAEATTSSDAPKYRACAGIVSFKADTLPMACGEQSFEVKFALEYINPDGDLMIDDTSTGKNVVKWKLPTSSDPNATLQFDTTIRVTSLTPAKHIYHAYLQSHPNDYLEDKIESPKFVRCPEVIKVSNEVTAKGCDSTAYDVKLTVEYVNPDDQLVVEDAAGKVLYQETVDAGALNEPQTVTISLRVAKLENCTYRVYINGHKADAKTTTAIAPEFEKCCIDGLMYRKWDNVIFIDNHDSVLVAYQWYKNGQILTGETKQRLYTGDRKMAGTSDLYHCQLTYKDGTTDLTCPHTFDELPRSVDHTAVEDIMVDGFAVYPTQVPAGAVITITKTVPGTVRATLLSLTGQTVGTMLLTGDESTMTMPGSAGIYLLQLQGKETHSTVKINVY